MDVIRLRLKLLPQTELLVLFFHVERYICSSKKADAASLAQLVRGVYRKSERSCNERRPSH